MTPDQQRWVDFRFNEVQVEPIAYIRDTLEKQVQRMHSSELKERLAKIDEETKSHA